MGVGEAMAYQLAHPDEAPRVADCQEPPVLRRKLVALRDRLTAEVGLLEAPPVDDCVAAFMAFAARVSIVDGLFTAALLQAGDVVFEGAQGVLLDEWHGFHPYTTWSTTTFANADKLLAEAGMAGEATRLGVLRVVTTRHGPGPLVTEDQALRLTDPHNPTNAWQGRFRFGHFDAVAHRYALAVAGGVDGLVLTHLDAVDDRLLMCHAYDWTDRLVPGPAGDLDRQAALTQRLMVSQPRYGEPPSRRGSARPRGGSAGRNGGSAGPRAGWVAAVEEALHTPVVLTSSGPTAEDKSGRVAVS
jgi:adenylosuccinate synthase